MNEFPLQGGNINDGIAVSEYVETSQYERYVRHNGKVALFVDALYRYCRETADYELLAKAIRYDNRDKQYSVAWLRAFRTAIRDNETEMVKVLFREISWPIDLVADALEIDGVRAVDGLFLQGNKLDSHPDITKKAYRVSSRREIPSSSRITWLTAS